MANQHDRRDAERILRIHGTSLYRLCMMMLGHRMDAEDALSETMLRYMTKAPIFWDEKKEKSWLFTVAANVCRDMLRKRKYTVQLDEAELKDYAVTQRDREILYLLEGLPEKYRTVLCLHYVEGYGTEEMAQMLHIRSTAVRKRLQYARELLKLEYEQEVES